MRTAWKCLLFLLCLPLIAVLAGCGVTTANTGSGAGSFSVSADQPTITLAPGSIATVTVTLTGADGFSGTANIVVSGMPTGVTISPATANIAAGASQAFVITASSTAALGTTQLTVQGTSGTLSGSTAVSLVIQSSTPPPAADFTFAATPGSLSIAVGGTGQVTLTATATNGFSAPVAVALTGLPAGVTASPATITLTPGTPQTVTLTVAASAAAVSSAPLKFTATSGSLSHSASVALTITTVTPPPPAVDFTIAASPSTLTVTSGSTGTALVTIGAINGFSGAVNVAISGLPLGVTAKPATTSVAVGTPQAIVFTVAPGTYSPPKVVVVTGTYTDSTGAVSPITHTANLVLNIVTPPPIPDFSLDLAPTSLTILEGASATTAISLTGINGFTGTATIAPGTLPAGVTITPASTSLTAGTPQTLTVKVDPSAALGTSTILLNGTSGALNHAVALTLTVTGTQTAADFSLALVPTSLSVQQNSSGQTVLSAAAINGFAGTINVVPGSLPSGVTISPTTISVTPGASQPITLNVSASASLGSTPITFTGTSGALSHSVVLNLTITPSATSPDFTLALTPSSLTVAPGSAGQTSLSAAALNGFTGAIDVVASGLPTGVTLSPSPISVTPGTPATLIFTVASGTANGTATVTLTATSGSIIHAITLSLTIGTPPDFSITPTPLTQTVDQGSTSNPVTLAVTPVAGFTDNVSVTISGLPTGVTASPSSLTIAPGSPQPVVFNATAGAALGTATVTFTGVDGTLTHSTTLALTVEAPQPPEDFSIALTPTAQTITKGLSGSPISVAVTGINGFTSPVTVTLTGLPTGVTAAPSTLTITPGTPQTITLTVSATAALGDSTIAFTGRSGSTNHEADLSLTVSAPLVQATDVTTYHYDISRSGTNPNEGILTPANVTSATFGKIGFDAVDGKVDAQPLYVSAINMGGAQRNVLYVATEHGSVYAFDADSGTQLIQTSLLGANETPSDDHGCGQITPEIGITSTPVIDRSQGANGTIFLVAMSKDAGGHYHQRLHALDLTTLAELQGGPTEITASYPGNGATSVGGVNTFDPGQYAERASLLLQGGHIYLSWTSHCDQTPYSGWVMAYSETTLQQTSVLNLTPNGSEGSVWMSGGGLAADAAGNVYLLDANGTFDTTLDASNFPSLGDYGNSFLKLSTTGGTLAVADYFEPFNGPAESASDTDLGSGGIILIDVALPSPLPAQQFAVGAGKDGNLYIVDRTNMGKYNATKNKNLGTITGFLPNGAWSSPAYFNGALYYGGVGTYLKSFVVTAKVPPGSPPPAATQSANTFPYPGATPSVSANGSLNGIVWALESGEGSPAVLHAYTASNLATELYNSNQASSNRDAFGNGNKFITPMIINGKVYVGTPNGVAVFGLLP